MRVAFGTIVLALAALRCGAAHADPASSYSVFSPVPQDQLRPLCTDRPGKATSACTVDAGHIQIEMDAFDEISDRSGSVVSTAVTAASPTLKLGLDDAADIEVTLAPYVAVRTHDRGSDARGSSSGFGDLILHGKFMLTGNGETVTAALDPFLKVPTADEGLGNGAVEGGLVVPLGYALSDDWSLGMTPEMDILKDSGDGGYHASLSDVVGIARAFGNITLGGELWGNFDFNPAGTTDQYSFDLTATWQPPQLRDLQLDGGVNFALNRNTPRTEIYMGVSQRL